MTQTQTNPTTKLGTLFPAIFGHKQTGISIVSPSVRAAIVLRDECIRRYARVLTALFVPKARGRKAAAEERAKAFEAAKADLRDRMVMDPSNPSAPVLFHGGFEWKPGNGKYSKRYLVRTTVMLGGEDVIAVPPISVKMDWLKQDSEERWVSNGEFYFFLFRPVPAKDDDSPEHHIAFPVGLCSKKIVSTVNGLYDEQDQKSGKAIIVEPIESDFDRTGTRKFTYTATTCQASKNNPKQMILGHYMGKIIMTEPDTGTPSPLTEERIRKNKETGEDEIYQAHAGFETAVYRYTEGGNVIVVKFLGSEGTISDTDEVRFLDVAYEADPFEGLGMSPLMFENDAAVVARGVEIEDLPLDENHPMLAMVVNSLGLTTWDADIGVQIDHVREVMGYCVVNGAETVRQLRQTLEGLFAFTDFETIGKALSGVDLIVLKDATEGEDILTQTISAKTEAPFDWDMTMYKSLRLWLIEKSVAAVATPPAPTGTQTGNPAQPAAPAHVAPDTEAKRPDVTFRQKVRGAWITMDAYAFLGLAPTIERASDVLAALQITKADLTVVALAIEPQLTSKGKKALDPEKDAAKLDELIAVATEQITAACTRVVTGTP